MSIKTGLIENIKAKALASDEGAIIDGPKFDKAVNRLAKAIIAAVGESDAAAVVMSIDANRLADHIRAAENGERFEVDFNTYLGRF